MSYNSGPFFSLGSVSINTVVALCDSIHVAHTNGITGKETIECTKDSNSNYAQSFTDIQKFNFICSAGSLYIQGVVSDMNLKSGPSSNLVLDYSSKSNSLSIVINSTHILGLGGIVTYSGFGSVKIILTQFNDEITITGNSDTKLTIDGGGGIDDYTVTPETSSYHEQLDTFVGQVTIDETEANTLSFIFDYTDIPLTGEISSSAISGFGMNNLFYYKNMNDITFILGNGDDNFVIRAAGTYQHNTNNFPTTINVFGCAGDDNIKISDDGIVRNVTVFVTGSCDLDTNFTALDTVIVDDSASIVGTAYSLNTTMISVRGITIPYFKFGKVVAYTGTASNTLSIFSTISGNSYVYAGAGDDTIIVSGIAGNTFLFGGDGADNYTIIGSSPNVSQLVNPLHGYLILDGECGDNNYYYTIAGTGASEAEISNNCPISPLVTLNLFTTNNDDLVLSRKDFLAVLHEGTKYVITKTYLIFLALLQIFLSWNAFPLVQVYLALTFIWKMEMTILLQTAVQRITIFSVATALTLLYLVNFLILIEILHLELLLVLPWTPLVFKKASLLMV